jgi:alpha-1,6-mannosyltransferase
MQVTEATTLGHSQTRIKRIQLSPVFVPGSLFLLGSSSLVLYFWGRDLHRFTQWIAAYIGLFVGQLALYLLACFVVDRWCGKWSSGARWMTLVLIVFFGAMSRAILVPQRPYLSSDVYRYVWDGQVQKAGVNPYRYVPEASELTWLRDEKIYPNIPPEDRHWTSPYPPVAQLVFLGVARVRPMSVTAVKAAMASFDIVSALILMLVLARSGLDPARAIVFAWNPLVIFESAHSGHLEAVYLLFLAVGLLAWTHKQSVLTGTALGLATMVKFYPILLLPAFFVLSPETRISNELNDSWKRFSWRVGRLMNTRNVALLLGCAVAIIVVYLPYWNAGGNLFAFVRGYIEEEGFVHSGARYFFLELIRRIFPVPTTVFVIFGFVLMTGVALRQLIKEKHDSSDVAQSSVVLIGTYLLLTTPRYAWYYVWLVPFLCFVSAVGWLYLSAASVLLYLVWYTPLVYPEIPGWLGISIYVPVLVWLLWGRYIRRRNVEAAA